MVTVEVDPDAEDDGPADIGSWLVDRRRSIDGGELDWLDVLAEFDKQEAWRVDGQLTCAAWLGW